MVDAPNVRLYESGISFTAFAAYREPSYLRSSGDMFTNLRDGVRVSGWKTLYFSSVKRWLNWERNGRVGELNGGVHFLGGGC